MDNRDSGKSFRANIDYTIVDMAKETTALINHLNLENITLVGHSMGGFIALYVAAELKNRIDSLTLCSTAIKQVSVAKEYLKKRCELVSGAINEGKTAKKQGVEEIKSVMQMIYSEGFMRNQKAVSEVIEYETKKGARKPLPRVMR